MSRGTKMAQDDTVEKEARGDRAAKPREATCEQDLTGRAYQLFHALSDNPVRLRRT